MKTSHKIIFSDSRNLQSLVSDNTVDLVVTSPPYPMIPMWDSLFSILNPRINEDSFNTPSNAFDMMHHELDKTWLETFRILKPGGFACINIGDAARKSVEGFRMFSNHSRIIECCHKIGFEILPLIIWRKTTNSPTKFMGSGTLPAGAYVTLEHEYILIMKKPGKRNFISDSEKKQRRESSIFWEERNQWYSDLWQFKGIRQKIVAGSARERSAAFPFEVPFRLINMLSVKNDIVFDPFAGTGTTMKAAAFTCRNSIGVEIDHDIGELFFDSPENFKTEGNSVIEQRITSHIDFLTDYKKKKQLKGYKNKHYGFDVVTRLEKELYFNKLKEIFRTSDNEFQIEYETYEY